MSDLNQKQLIIVDVLKFNFNILGKKINWFLNVQLLEGHTILGFADPVWSLCAILLGDVVLSGLINWFLPILKYIILL